MRIDQEHEHEQEHERALEQGRPGPTPQRGARVCTVVKAVLFDLDGTLVDTLRDIAAGANHALAAQGLPIRDESFYREAVGDGAPVLIGRVVPEDRQEMVPAVLDGFRQYYPQHMFDTSRPYDGVQSLLAELAGRQVPLAVLSNKPEEMTRAMVATLLADVPFVAVWGQVAHRPKKPDPAAALALSAQLGVPPADCAFVGDTPVDMKTARRAAMRAIGVPWGFRPVEELLRAGAHRVVDRPAEILDFLDS
jgi:phosphoglycolate phosphatase